MNVVVFSPCSVAGKVWSGMLLSRSLWTVIWLVVSLSVPALLLLARSVRVYVPGVVVFMLSHCIAW